MRHRKLAISLITLTVLSALAWWQFGESQVRHAVTMAKEHGHANRNTRRISDIWIESKADADILIPLLGRLKDLRSLYVWKVDLTETHLQGIAKLQNISEFRADNCQLDDNDLAFIGKLSRLEKLSIFLNATRIEGRGFKSLQELSLLRELDLSFSEVNGQGLEALRVLPRLRYINLCGSGLDDAGLDSLLELRSLESVVLLKTNVTRDGAIKLAALPNLADPVSPPEPSRGEMSSKEWRRLKIEYMKRFRRKQQELYPKRHFSKMYFE